MPQRKPSAASLKHRPGYLCEGLETRYLLTTLHGGDIFLFRAPDKNLQEIALTGNITAEILGARVEEPSGSTGPVTPPALANLPGSLNGTPVDGGIQPEDPGQGGGGANTPYFNDTIYTIYLAQSDINATITSFEIDKQTGIPIPFGDGSGSLRVTNAQNGKSILVAAPGGTGPALLGARTSSSIPAPGDNIPFDSFPVPGGTFAALPGSITNVAPGIIGAPGQDLGRFFFGGTMLGQVNIHGSLDSFYAGWLLTGTAGGLFAGQLTAVPHNFNVDGDARSILSKGAIGTETGTNLDLPDFISGFDLRVGGRLGEVRSGDSVYGTADVLASPTAPHILAPNQHEVESRSLSQTFDLAYINQLSTARPTELDNDTFATAEYHSTSDPSGTISIDGSLSYFPNATPPIIDMADYYGVPVMAGQTVTVKLTSIIPSLTGELNVGVFDPDGREIATDYNKTDLSQTQERPFQFVAAKGGIYRVAVAQNTNGLFVANPTTGILRSGTFPYNVQVSGVGDLAFGAITAPNTIYDGGFTTRAYHVGNGDFGALAAGGSILSAATGATAGGGITNSTSITVDNGNLRSVDGANIGKPAGTNGSQSGIEVTVPNGGVGLIRGTSTDNTGRVAFNQFTTTAIGGDVQTISAGGLFSGNIIANGSLGVLRAGRMDDLSAFVISVNTDRTGPAGTIDLIDVTGDLGTLASGGPAISTGPAGNVRYMHVGGTVYRDAFFGGSQPEGTVYQPGESVNIVDDSGTPVTIAPTGSIPGAVAGTPSTSASLTVTTYGIEGSGGSVVVRVVSDGGVDFTGSGASAGQTAEIGDIVVNGTGTPVVAGTTTTVVTGPPTGGTGVPTVPTVPTGTGNTRGGRLIPLPPAPVLQAAAVNATPANLSVGFGGNARIDAFSITGANFNSIHNDTPGELANITATTIGDLRSSGTIGIIQGHYGGGAGAVDPTAVINGGNTYPFDQQHYGIVTSGSIVSITAGQGMGNIISGDAIGSVSGTNLGPVVATNSIHDVNIGTGIPYSGSGAVGFSGIYAGGTLGMVSNTAPANIRGNILSSSGIVGVDLHKGSIIRGVIANYADFTSAEQFSGGAIVAGTVTPITNPTIDLGSVTVTDGGIIGSLISANHIGPISVRKGYGIFDTAVDLLGDGTLQSITTDGYGLRNGTLNGGASIGNVAALGDGSDLSTAQFSPDVRFSETGAAFDPAYGTEPNLLTDISVWLTTDASTHSVAGRTDTGAIENYTVLGSRNLDSMSAHIIRGITPPNSTFAPLFVSLQPFTFVNVANRIGTIKTTGTIDGLSITTGQVKNFAPAGDVSRLDMTVAGYIQKLTFNGNVLNSSSINATGVNGHIGNLIVHGNMNGAITATGRIQKVQVDKNLTGTVTGRSVGTLQLGAGLGNGSLVIQSSVDVIKSIGDLGAVGDVLTINGTLKKLQVGGNLNANVNVSGSLRAMQVNGSVISGSTTTVTGAINSLRVNGDVQTGAAIVGHPIKRQIIKGQLLGTVTSA